jgi:hypothetical protein
MPETWQDIIEQLKAAREYDPTYRASGHVMGLLSKLDKPDNVLRAYAYHALANDDMDLVERINRAWQQKDEYSWGDVLGIPRPNEEYYKRVGAINQALKAMPEADQPGFRQSLMNDAEESRDSLLDYTQKGGARLGLDMVLSALNILPGLGVAKGGAKAAQGLSKTAKAAEGVKGWRAGRGFVGGKLAGSKYIDPILHYDVGKHMPWLDRAKQATSKATGKLGEKWAASPTGQAFGGPMSGRFQDLESGYQTAAAHAQGLKEVGMEKAATAKKKLDKLTRELKITTPKAKEDYYRQIIQAIERPGEPTNVDPRALGIMTPLRVHDLELAKMSQAAGKPYGREMSLIRDVLQDPNMPVGYYPHMLGQEGREFFKKGTGIPGVEASALRDEPHRTLQRLVDPEALEHRQLMDVGDTVVGKVSDPRTGVIKRTVDGKQQLFRQVGDELVPVEAIPASLEEATTAYSHLQGKFIEKPIEAFALHSQKAADKIGLFNALDAMKNTTIKVKKAEIGPGGQKIMKEIDSPLLVPVGPNMPEGFRPLNVKGLEGWATHGVPANRFENIARGKMDPSAMIGALDASMKMMEKSPAGEWLGRYRRAWARNVLALHPGFWTANIATDLSLAYMSGVNNLPMRIGESTAVLSGVKRPVIKGLPNEVLAKMARDYRVTGSSWAESMQYGDIAREIEPRLASQARRWAEMTGDRVDRAIGRGIERVGHGWEDLNNWAFKHGSKTSDMVRMAVFIDQLKKAKKAGNILSDDVIARAAQYSKEAMIDYGDLSHFTQSMKNIDPFISWYQGIIKRTLKDVIKKPERLNRASKFFDFVLEPMDPESMEAAPEYIKDMNPVTGIMGRSFGGGKNPLMLGLSRFTPWGTPEQLYRDPVGSLWETAAPYIKTPIGLGTNYNTFFGQNIDPQAQSGVGAMVNPMLDPSGEFNQWSVAYRKPFGLNMPAAWDYALSNLLPQGRTLKEVETLGRAFSKAMGYPIWQDPGAPELTPKAATAWFMGGGKLHEFDKVKGLANQYYDLQGRMRKAAQKKNEAIRKGDVELQKKYTIQEYALKKQRDEFKARWDHELEVYKQQATERKEERKTANALLGEDYYRRYKRSQLTGTPVEKLPSRKFDEPVKKEPTMVDVLKKYIEESGYTPEEIKELEMSPDDLITFLNIPKGALPKEKQKKSKPKKPSVAEVIQEYADKRGWTKDELEALDYSNEELINMLKIPRGELKKARKKKTSPGSFLRKLGLSKEQAEEFTDRLR